MQAVGHISSNGLGVKISRSNELAAMPAALPGYGRTWRARGCVLQALSRNAGGKARESALTLRI
jgi:hypothetical protein